MRVEVRSPDEAALVSRATLRAATRLGLTDRSLAIVIGVSEATVSQIRTGTYLLQPDQKPFELAVLLMRLHRSLDAVLGGDDAVAAWMKAHNSALGGEPISLIQTASGLLDVTHYLDARCAHV